MSGGFVGRGRTEVVTPDELTPVDDYVDFVLDRLPRPTPIEIPTVDALGLITPYAIESTEALPGFANAAMDGYAVVASDLVDVTEVDPAGVRVIGEVRAGANELPTVSPGHAVRIMTGAPLPPGADTVVPVEVTTEEDGVVWVHRPPVQGEHVRPVGQDVTPGTRLIEAGQRIAPGHIALLIAAGHPRVWAYPAPRVAVLSTGDELVGYEGRLEPGQIRDSNGPMLAALVRQAGALPHRVGRVGDDPEKLAEALDASIGHADLFLCTGGVSAGSADYMHEVLSRLGEVHAYKLAMKPGMPQMFGEIHGIPVLALPGNPVSAFVSFEVIARPAIRRMQGRGDARRPTVKAVMTADVRSPSHKRSYVRVKLVRQDRRWLATPTGHQGSHVLSSIAAADGLAVVPAHVAVVRAEETVDVLLLADL